MIRRLRSTGKFYPPPPLADVPLLAHAFSTRGRAKSASHLAGWWTRRAPVRDGTAQMRGELGL